MKPERRVRTRIVLASDSSLHPGSARIALLNWMLAKRRGGEVLLRQTPDCAEGVISHAEQDLRWLGLSCDEPARDLSPSRYADAAATLKRSGRLYPCLESDEELRAKRDWRVRRGKSPVYDRAMLKLTAAQLAAAEAGGKRPHWRFRLSDAPLSWTDLVLGRTDVKLTAMSDPVMIRADGTLLPPFTAGVDDLADGITHIIQGEDHVGRSAIQLDLLEAMGGDPAAMHLAHVPQMLSGAPGTRFEGLTLRRLRSDGLEPSALAAYLATLGTGGPAVPGSVTELAQSFDIAALTRVPASFDIGDLQALNRRVLAETDFADVAARLPSGATEAFWTVVRGNIDLLGEAADWWQVASGTVVPPVIDGQAGFLRSALDLLPPEPWNAAVWSVWSEAIRRSDRPKRTGAA